MKLTIAVPTFDRNDCLKQVLAGLLPQVTSECRVMILDNCSNTPVSETLGEMLGQYADRSVEIVRHRTNIGASANILRCFELCETEWLWILGDDDVPCPDAVTTILQSIDAQPDCVFFNFASELHERKERVLTKGLDDFVRKIDSHQNLLFISSAVWKAPAMYRGIRFGYQYSYSFAPNLALLLASLTDESVCCLSEQSIIGTIGLAPRDSRWFPADEMLGRAVLLGLPMSHATRKALAKVLSRSHKVLPEFAAVNLVLLARREGTNVMALYMHDQMCSRLYYFERDPILRMRLICCRLLVRFPRFGYKVMQLFFRVFKNTSLIRGRQLGDDFASDRFERL